MGQEISKGRESQKSTWDYIREGILYVCSLRNTITEFKSLPIAAKLVFTFLIAGLVIYFVLVGDYTFWGWLAIIGLVFSAINLVLVDNGKLTSYFWGVLCSLCTVIGAWYYHMWGDFCYYLVIVFPWMIWGVGNWGRLAESNQASEAQLASDGETTQMLSVPRPGIWKYALLFVASYVAMYLLSIAADGAIPWLDSFILSCGVIGQIFLSRSYKQQWIMWLAQDIIAVTAWGVRLPMAVATGDMTSYALSMVIMWGIFLVNAVYGTYMWYRKPKDAGELPKKVAEA